MTIPGYVYELCRTLRARQTSCEEILWQCLRNRRLHGYKFRRQHPLGRYVADFYCAEARLVIEVEGSVHDIPDQQEYDEVRRQELCSRNLRVLTFRNADVAERLDEVLATVVTELGPCPGDLTP